MREEKIEDRMMETEETITKYEEIIKYLESVQAEKEEEEKFK